MKRRKFFKLFARSMALATGSAVARRALDSIISSGLRRTIAAGQGAAVAPALVASTREALVSHVTITNAWRSDKVNEFFYFGFPLGDSELPGGTTLAIYDDDGSGGRGPLLSNFQLDNIASDLSNNRRFVTISGILPNLSGNGTRVLQVWRHTVPSPSGVAITTANLLELAGMANGGVVVNQTIAGTTYVARLDQALAGKTTFSKAAACNHGSWRTGPCVTEFIVSIPASAGGMAHNAGDGLRIEFHVKAWKASPAPVSNRNPILGMWVFVVCRNGHRSAMSQFAVSSGSIQRMTSLSNATLIDNEDTDSEGRTIVYNWTTAWTHWGGAEWIWEVFCGAKPTNVCMLGDATLTGGSAVKPMGNQLKTRLAMTGMFPFYKKVIGDISHTDRIRELNFTSRNTPLQFGGTKMGNQLLNIGAGGNRPELGLISGWNVAGVTKYDADGRRIIFENARYIGAQRFNALAMDYNVSTKRYLRNGDSYPSAAAEIGGDPWTYGDPPSHEIEQSYTAYLLTGDYYYYHTLNARVAGYCGQEQHLHEGFGQNFTWFGDWSKGGQWLDHYAGWPTPYRTNSQQERSTAWGTRTVYMQALLCPDRFTTETLLSWDKRWSQTWVKRHWERWKNIIVSSTQPGSTYDRFGRVACRFLTDQANPTGGHAFWTWGYVVQSMAFASICGMGNADLIIGNKWLADWYVGMYNEPAVFPDLVFFVAHGHFIHPSTGAFIDTPTGFYSERAMRNPLVRLGDISSRGSRWMMNGTATLSATSGPSITVTLPANVLSTSRAAWYLGKWFTEHARGGNGPGSGQISAVLSPNQIRMTTTVSGGATFSTNTLTNSNWSMCPPAMPEDSPGHGTMPYDDKHQGRVVEFYITIHRGAAALLTQADAHAGIRKVYEYMNTYLPNTRFDNEQHDMRPGRR